MPPKDSALNIRIDEEQEREILRAADVVIATRGDGTRSGILREWLLDKARRINESAVPGPGTDATGMLYTLEGEE